MQKYKTFVKYQIIKIYKTLVMVKKKVTMLQYFKDSYAQCVDKISHEDYTTSNSVQLTDVA